MHLACICAGIPRRCLGHAPEGVFATWGPASGRGLYVTGPVGAGKTWAVSALAERLVRSGMRRVVMRTSPQAFADIRSDFGKSSEVSMERFSTCDVLILDDLGKEAPTDWVLSTLWRIVDARYGALRPTVVTTQYTTSQLMRRLSRDGDSSMAEAIVSRLRGSSQGVVLTGPDRRLKEVMR